MKGEVVAVGHGTKDEEMVLKVGDTVLYGKYAGTELEVEGSKYHHASERRTGSLGLIIKSIINNKIVYISIMAKEILFNIDARDQLKKGVDALANAVK